MQKIILALGLIAVLAFPCAAQETYSVGPVSAPDVLTLSRIVSGSNVSTCGRFTLPIGCTQAQACTAAGAAGGSGCTAAQARAADARIYALTQAGREEYVTFKIALPSFRTQEASLPGFAIAAKCVAFAAMNQTAKDAELTSIGWPTGGTTCPYQ